MPGICGIIRGTSAETSRTHLATMADRMRHEPAMRAGDARFDRLGTAAAWVVHPGSFADCMPVWNEDRTLCLIFSGEEFSGLDLRAELRKSEHDALKPDASALVPGFEQLGAALFSRLNGTFSGVLVDLRQDTVTLFNDRYGLGRVYYHEGPGGFYFASEAKSLLAVLPHARRIDQRGLAEFYSVGCVLQHRSLFTGISLLPPASCWTFHRDGRVEKKTYFDPAVWEQQPRLDAAAYREQLEAVFSRVAKRYLQGPQPLAMSLTGGLDSRLLLAWAKAAPGSLPCYTFGGPYRDCADVRIARRLAEISGQSHATIRIERSFFEDFPALAEKTIYFSDGAMDVSGAVELYVNRRARAIAPVRLTGNYGSEILRSNVAFRPARLDTTLFTPEFARLLDEAAETYRHEANGHRLSFIAFKQVPWHHYARSAVERSQLTPRSPFLDNELVALAYRAPQDLATSAAPLLDLIARGEPKFDAVTTDRALRTRSFPLLTPVAKAWQEFTVRAEYAYDYGMPPWLARTDRVFGPLHLEKLFLGRHKFYHFRVWYRDQLGAALRNGVFDLEASQPGCYREGIGRKLVHAHTTGRANHTLELHKLLSVQLTGKLFTESPAIA